MSVKLRPYVTVCPGATEEVDVMHENDRVPGRDTMSERSGSVPSREVPFDLLPDARSLRAP